MGRRNRRSKPDLISQIARERIDILFNLAQENSKTHPERAKRYISLARKIGTRYLVRLKKNEKLSFCKSCNALQIPGYNQTVRLIPRHKVLEYTCECGEKKRIPYGKLKPVNPVE
jgi:ribonuclease P protein subunit RPR2